ncbi:MAG: hypothetical protein WBL21_09030 [Salinimicrobium sp.]
MKKFLILLLLSLQVTAQEYSVKKGLVVDSLKVSDTLSETYALYLPTSFSNTKNWPVIFLFDPEGRGKSVAQLFKPVAQEQGYLLVSSNDISSENELEENIKIAARLVSSVSPGLPVDYQQVVVVGSLDGAKVATYLPLMFSNIFGVLAAGNQFLNLDLLDRKNDFAFIGIVGDEQFSVTAMNLTAAALQNQKHLSMIYTYEGGSDWPKLDLISSAVGSLSLEAMRNQFRPTNLELVNKLYQADISRVNRMMSNQKLLEAWDLLELMDDKYDKLKDLDEVEQKQNQLRRSRSFLEQRREQEAVILKEDQLKSDFFYYFQEDVKTANFENLGWWNYQNIKLDSLAQKGGSEGKMAKRLKGFVKEMAKVTLEDFQKKNPELENELIANMILTIFDSKNYKAYKRIITLSSQDNDFSTALFYFEEMLKHGYRDKEGVYNIDGTLALKMTPDFNWLVEKYIGTPKFYDIEN